jgi:hypothetical protein
MEAPPWLVPGSVREGRESLTFPPRPSTYPRDSISIRRRRGGCFKVQLHSPDQSSGAGAPKQSAAPKSNSRGIAEIDRPDGASKDVGYVDSSKREEASNRKGVGPQLRLPARDTSSKRHPVRGSERADHAHEPTIRLAARHRLEAGHVREGPCPRHHVVGPHCSNYRSSASHSTPHLARQMSTDDIAPTTRDGLVASDGFPQCISTAPDSDLGGGYIDGAAQGVVLFSCWDVARLDSGPDLAPWRVFACHVHHSSAWVNAAR